MRLNNTLSLVLSSLMSAMTLTACGGGGSNNSDNTPPDPEPASYRIGGELIGLASGKSLVLRNNDGTDFPQSSNGAFEFPAQVEAGKTYNVTVATQPVDQSCTVTNGSGTASGKVSNIQVACTDVNTVDTSSAACMDSPKLRTPENSYNVLTAEGTTRYYVERLANYHGVAVVQTSILPPKGIAFRIYSNLTNGMLLNYGSASALRVPIFEIYYEPGRGFPVALNLNQTYTSQVTMVNVNYNVPNTYSTLRDTITYLGREPVTTAFGTFETCRMRLTTLGDDGVLKTWDSWLVGVGKFAGLSVQQKTDAGITQPTNITVSWD